MPNNYRIRQNDTEYCDSRKNSEKSIKTSRAFKKRAWGSVGVLEASEKDCETSERDCEANERVDKTSE